MAVEEIASTRRARSDALAGCSRTRFRVSPGSFATSYSSGFGAAMYFQPPLRTVRSGLHPKSSSGAKVSAYNVRKLEVGDWRLEGGFGDNGRDSPSASNRPRPAIDAIVGATSTSDTES